MLPGFKILADSLENTCEGFHFSGSFILRFSVSLKSLDNYFFRWSAYKSLFSRSSVLINYMWSSNHFSISSCFPCFSGSRFFRVQVQVLEAALSVTFMAKLELVSVLTFENAHLKSNRKSIGSSKKRY